MNAELSSCERNAFLEDLAAELTDAAYQLALLHGVNDKWLDSQLDLWKAITQALANRPRLHSTNRLEFKKEALCVCDFDNTGSKGK